MVNLGAIFGSISFRPSDYKTQPELWLANQAGHTFLGVWFALVSCGLWFFASGDFPRRVAIWFIISIGYLSYEILRQSWRGWDTVEDWLFVTFYGAGGTLYCFHEVSPGDPSVVASLYDILLVSAVATVHLFVGAGYRAAKRLEEKAPPDAER